jgi:chromosome segregation ATPase
VEVERNSLGGDCQFLRDKCARIQQELDYYEGLGQKHAQLLEKCTQMEVILQQKDQIISKHIRSRNEAQATLEQEIQLLKAELERRMSSPTSFEVAGLQFEQTVNKLIDDNNKLKNSIAHLQAKLEELHSQNSSLESTVRAYE